METLDIQVQVQQGTSNTRQSSKPMKGGGTKSRQSLQPMKAVGPKNGEIPLGWNAQSDIRQLYSCGAFSPAPSLLPSRCFPPVLPQQEVVCCGFHHDMRKPIDQPSGYFQIFLSLQPSSLLSIEALITGFRFLSPSGEKCRLSNQR